MLRNATVAGKAGMGVPSEGRWPTASWWKKPSIC